MYNFIFLLVFFENQVIIKKISPENHDKKFDSAYFLETYEARLSKQYKVLKNHYKKGFHVNN